MSCVSYDTPMLNQRDATSVNAFLQEFVRNLDAAGLIRVPADPALTVADTYVSANPVVDYNPNTFAGYYNSLSVKSAADWFYTQYVCTMIYKLPVGNGNIQFVDDNDNIGYKKIAIASYDDTEVIIRFNIFLNSIAPSSTTLNHMFLICSPHVYASKGGSLTYITSLGTGYLYYSGVVASNYNVNMNMEGKSYVSLTQNALSVVIGCHSLSGLYAYNNNNYRHYMVNFTIYRKNGYIYIYGQTLGGKTTSTFYDVYLDDRSDLILWSYNPNNNKVSSWWHRSLMFLYWPLGLDVVAETATNNILGSVYLYSDNYIVGKVPELAVTRFMETNPREIKSVYKINNNLVIGNYVNLGLSERSQCPVDRSTKNYSWAFLFEPSTIFTTEQI